VGTTRRAADDRTLADLRAETHALVGQVRDAVTAHVLRADPDPAADQSAVPASGLLTTVPVGVCVRLVEVWHAARDAGFAQDDLTAELGDEDRLVFEMVVGMYDTACQTPLPLLLESVVKLRDALS
jgi:hypothetical protein